MLYFAYGSNMDPEQFERRCPGNRFIGIGMLPDHMLCFPRYSTSRNCGVASVMPQAGRHAWGVVFELTATDLAALDVFEGFREDRAQRLNSYNRALVTVDVEGVPTQVTTYLAVPQGAKWAPSNAYLGHIRRGARHHGLPVDYIHWLDAIETA